MTGGSTWTVPWPKDFTVSMMLWLLSRRLTAGQPQEDLLNSPLLVSNLMMVRYSLKLLQLETEHPQGMGGVFLETGQKMVGNPPEMEESQADPKGGPTEMEEALFENNIAQI